MACLRTTSMALSSEAVGGSPATCEMKLPIVVTPPASAAREADA
jgi:hypothetical protein